jgi:hypothetical protein
MIFFTALTTLFIGLQAKHDISGSNTQEEVQHQQLIMQKQDSIIQYIQQSHDKRLDSLQTNLKFF